MGGYCVQWASGVLNKFRNHCSVLVERLSSLVEGFSSLVEGLAISALVERLSSLIVVPVLVSTVVVVEVGLSSLVVVIEVGLASLVEGLSAFAVVVVEVGLSALLVVVEGLSALLVVEGFAALLVEGLAALLRLALLGLGLGGFLLLIILILIFLSVLFFLIEVVIEVLIIFKSLILILLILRFFLGGSGGGFGLLDGLGLLLGLLLGGLGFLLGGGDLGGCGSDGGLLNHNFFTLFLAFLFSLEILLSERNGFFLDLIEASQVDGSIALGNEDGLIEEGKEEIDDNMGTFLGEGGNEELLVFALDEKGD